LGLPCLPIRVVNIFVEQNQENKLTEKRKILSADLVRALAILFVATYHFFPELIPNGWVGVDLFFILSGFLLFNLVQTQGLKKFLRSRLYRIGFPLVVFCFLAVPLSFFLFKSIFWLDVLVFPGVTAVFGSANLYFYLFQDYFNKLSYQPFLHLWSLGPEIQFILFIGILNFLVRRVVFFWVMFVVGLLSFSVNYLVSDLMAQFYLTPLRLYEFVAGCFARVIYQRQLSGRLPSLISALIGFLTIIGLLVLSAGVIDVNRFEVSNMALIFTFIFLIFGDEKYWNICSAYVSAVALRSYSIYLIHYPYAFFSKTLSLSTYETLLIVVLNLISAEIFYKFIDLKVQSKMFDIKLLRWPLILGISTISVMLLVWLLGDKKPPLEKLDINQPSADETKIVALGDSHLPHAQLFLKEIGLSVDYVSVNCLPVPNTTHIYAVTGFSQKNEKCLAQNDLWEEKYADYDFILLAARWSHPFIGEIDKKRVLNQWSYETRLIRKDAEAFESTTVEESKRIFEAEMDLLASQVVARGQVLILFGEAPPLGATPTGCERLIDLFSLLCDRHFFNRDEALAKLNYTAEFFLELESKYRGNVIYIDVANNFCPDLESYCISRSGEFFIYSDDNHLNYQKLTGRKYFFDQVKGIKEELRFALEK
jgi:peptidoglycan/LPS O-acetylase OafA/YrhL